MHGGNFVSASIMGALLAGAAFVFPQAVAAQEAEGPLPLFDLVPVTSGNSDRFSIGPRVLVSYDSNMLRRNADLFPGPTDNIRVIPSVDATLNRQFGRTSVNLVGTFGYDYNSRFDYLNQERIGVRGGVGFPVGTQCPISLNGGYLRYQFDLADTETVAASVQEITNASFQFSCTRTSLTPTFGGSYQINVNSTSEESKSNYAEGHAGVQLSLPSLGTMTLTAQAARIWRPNTFTSEGQEEQTDILRVYLSLNRAVARRVRLGAKVGYASAKPNSPNVDSNSGLYIDGRFTYIFTPKVRVSLSALQDYQNSFGVSASYIIRREVRATLGLNVFNRTTISLTGAYVERNFENDATVDPTLLTDDKSQTYAMTINRRLGHRFRLGLAAGYRTRDANNFIYDYDSTSVSLSLGGKF